MLNSYRGNGSQPSENKQTNLGKGKGVRANSLITNRSATTGEFMYYYSFYLKCIIKVLFENELSNVEDKSSTNYVLSMSLPLGGDR